MDKKDVLNLGTEKHFVKTTDPDMAEYLRKAGFVELAKEGSRWVFINEVNKMIGFSADLKDV